MMRSSRSAALGAACASALVLPEALQAFTSIASPHDASRLASSSPKLRATARPGSVSAASADASGTSFPFVVGAAAAAVGATALAQKRRTASHSRSAVTVVASRQSKVPCAAGGAVGKKRVLVMGGTRFIGCYLVNKLRELGHDVVVVNRGKTNGGKPEKLPGTSEEEYQRMLAGVTVLVADRKEPEQLKAAIAAAGKFDIVFDNNVRKLAEVQPLVEGVQQAGGCEQFILMSSAGVYGPTDVLPLSEQNPGDPNSRHKEKLSCENYLESQGLNWTSIRPVYIYGPLNYNPVERYFFDRVSRGRPVCVPYDGKFITQLGHCEDLAEFMVQCVGNPAVKGQVYNLSGEEFITFDGMAKLCAEAAGAAPPKIVHYNPKEVDVPDGFPKAFPFRGMHFFASIEKAKQDVPSWRPKYSLLEGLKSSFTDDYVARGFDTKDPDFRTDYLILEKTGNLG